MSIEVSTERVRNEEISFRNGPVSLAGTLWLPCIDRPCPGVALVHGSGDDTRDDYEVFARAFAARGIAALIYDKRGVGRSMGSWRAGSFADLAGDALAGIAALAGRAEVDPRRVGLWGCSEGGWVAPLAASRSASVRFLVAVSTAGMSPARQEWYRRRLLIEAASVSRWRRALGMARVQLMFGLLRLLRHAPQWMLPGLAGYFARTMDFDPLPAWRAVAQPILLVYGAEDKTVPPRASAQLIERALGEARHQDVTVKVFAGGDHGIQVRDEQTGERRFVPGYLETVANWMLAR